MSSTQASVREQDESRSNPSPGNPSNEPLRRTMRSRKGCLTYRTRRIKCDEEKPSCQICIRYRLDCDYSYRFRFQDDTHRILTRMQAVSPENPRWHYSTIKRSREPDGLACFNELATDEDRESKASASDPGTYFVVVNRHTFKSLTEVELPTSSRMDTPTPWISLADPNIVILRQVSEHPEDARSSSPPIAPRTAVKVEDENKTLDEATSTELSLCCEKTRVQQENTYLERFLHIIWCELAWSESTRSVETVWPSIRPLEVVAKGFAPLLHAMIVVGAFSLAQDDDARTNAYLRYQEVLLELRNLTDLSADGVFWTHIVLLIYETVAAEPGRLNFLSNHLSTLATIALSRHQTETFPFAVWWNCRIDLDALLTNTGGGRFVKSLLECGALPDPDVHLYPLGPDGKSVIYDEELEDLPTVLRLENDVMILFVRLGILAHEFRSKSISYAVIESCQRKISQLQQEMQRLWNTYYLSKKVKSLDSRPTRAKILLDRAWALSRAFFIYSHTSMWQGQARFTFSVTAAAEIRECSSQILKTAGKAIGENRSFSRLFLFPLFLAGFACEDTVERYRALEYIRVIEQESFGRNAQVARETLVTVYTKQAEQCVDAGEWWSVNWKEVMREQSPPGVNSSSDRL